MAEEDPDRAFSELSASIAGPLTHDELLEIGHLGAAIVIARTKKGLDADGKKFVAYKPGYEKQRAARGLRVSPPDLAVSGHMLGAMGPEVTGQSEVTVGFASEFEAKKAATNNDGSKQSVAATSSKGKTYERKSNTDAREFLDVRMPREMDVMGDAISEILARRQGR